MELNNEFEVAVPVDEAWKILTDVEKIAPCMPGAELKEVEGDEYRGIVKVKVGPITASYRGAARFEELDPAAHKAVLKAEGRETRGQGNATAHITAILTPSEKGTKVIVSTDLAITGKVAQFGRGVLADVSGKLLDQFVHNLETTVLAAPPSAEATSSAAGSGTQAEAGASEEATATDSNGSAPPADGKERRSGPRRSRSWASTAAVTATETEAAEGGEPGPPEVAEQAAPSPAPATTGPRQIASAPVEPVDLVEVAGASVMRRLAPYLTVAGVLLIARIVFYSLRRRRK